MFVYFFNENYSCKHIINCISNANKHIHQQIYDHAHAHTHTCTQYTQRLHIEF